VRRGFFVTPVVMARSHRKRMTAPGDGAHLPPTAGAASGLPEGQLEAVVELRSKAREQMPVAVKASS
jgi:hypothetical protein